jgi:uncharacterized repeat protein (TIGR01451 family)
VRLLRVLGLVPAVLLSFLITACSGDEPIAPDGKPDPATATTEQAVWTNGDFESDAIGTSPPAGWTLTTNLNNGITDTRPSAQTLASLNLVAGGTSFTAVVGGATAESQTDPDLLLAGTLRYPKYGTRATRINSTGVATGLNRNVNTLKQTMTTTIGDVDTLDNKVHIRFAIAPILENPAHTYISQPYYFVRVQNLTKGTTIYSDFNTSGQAGVPWKDFTDASGQAAQYTDWMLVDIAPGDAQLAVGDQVELQVIASGCSLGGHWGRVYVDGVGSGVPGLFATATGPQSVNAGSTLTYTINYKNGGTTTTTNSRLDLVTPPNTTFTSVSLGAVCTTPAVGATGTVSCPLGTLPPGAIGSFTVTVTVPAATANGTLITNGNYSIYATGVSALLGPKVNTNVTSSVSYADVGVTLTDGIAAIGWGQATTYQLTVTNSGPVAAPSVTVADAMPAQLTGVTWTCAGTGGGVCAASGSGSINDATVQLPVGGQVRYTISASIIAGSGSGSVINTATATVGGSVSDPDTTNNTAVDSDSIGNLYTLSLTKTGSLAAGTVTSTPAAISCGAGCSSASADFLDGSLVQLTATPAAGSVFNGWGGACSGTATTCTLTMSAARSVTASFTGPTITITGGNNQTAGVSTGFSSPLTVQVTDSNGVAVNGAIVTFTVPSSGASATLSATTATTNASGFASVSATANSLGGSYQVTASVAGATPVNFTLTNLGTSASITVSSGGGQTTIVGTAFGAPLVALVRDLANQPVGGVTVTFTVPGSGASATLSSATAVTNASGLASITATANTVAGSYNATATVGLLTATFALTNTPGPAANLTLIAPTTRSATAGGALGTFTAEVTDSFGNVVPGVTITFAAPGSGASATLSAASAVTGSNGRASITATANTVAGSYAITASAPGLASQAFTISNTAGAAATLAIVSGNNQSATIGASFAPLVVVVRDAFNNPVAGATVTFTAPGSGASAAVTASTTTAANGQASTPATANTVAGSYSVTAASAGLTSVTFSLTNLAGPAAALTLIAPTTRSATVNTSLGTFTAEVTDAQGNLVPGVTVTFTAPASGASATLSAGSAVTGSDGRASITATANTVAGSYAITAGSTGLTSRTFTISNTAGVPAAISVFAGGTQSTAVTTVFATALTVRVVDASGNPVSGVTVAYTRPSSGASATLSAATATTGANGQAQVTATANPITGAYGVTAAVAGIATPATFSLTNLAGPAAALTLIAPTTRTATVGASFGTLTAEVTDAQGNVVPGVTVTFTAPSSGASATLSAIPAVSGASATSSAILAVTGADGRASITATANTVSGAYPITAAAVGVATPASFNLTNTAGPPATITVLGGSEQSAEIETAFAEPLRVEIRDAFGNLAPSATVTFTAPTSGATATVTTTVTTDASGVASTSATAGAFAGSYAVSASVAGVAASVTFNLTNTPGAATVIAVSNGDAQETVVDTTFPQPLEVVVTDRAGNPAPGVTIRFTAPGSSPSAQLSQGAVVTDASGHASITARADTRSGSYAVTAELAPGLTASFALRNLPGAPAQLLVAPLSSPQSATILDAYAEPLAAQVVDAFGNPVPGVTVTFAAPATGASAGLSTTTVVTDANGNVQVIATANASAGGYLVNASVAGIPDAASFQLTNLAGAPSLISVEAGGTQSAEVDTDFAERLTVKVVDAQGNPVPSAVVAFTASPDPATATLSASSVATGADGVASVSAHASTVTGAHVVTAVVLGAATPVAFNLTNTPGAPAAITADVGATPQQAQVATPYLRALLVHVVDRFGNPVPGATVTYAVPATDATGTLSATTITTDGSGNAAVFLTAGTVTGSFAATATIAGVDLPATFELTNLPGAAHRLVPVSGAAQSTVVATAFAIPLATRLTDEFGNPVPGQTVTFAAPASSTSATATLSPVTVVTDAQGLASTTATASTITGSYDVVATSEQSAAPNLFELTNTPDVPASAVAVPGATPQSAEVRHGFGAPIAVIVTDRFGNRVPGVLLDFTTPSGPGAVLSSPRATTDSDGSAQVIAIADGTAGSYQVSVQVPGLADPVIFELTNTAAAPSSIVIASGDGQSAMATTAFAAPLVFRVLDDYGNPVPSVVLTTTMTQTGPGAAMMTSSNVTSSSGTVSFTLVANGAIGDFAVTATSAGARGTATAALHVTAIPTQTTIEVPATVSIDREATVTIHVTGLIGTPAGTVEVLDAQGEVIGTGELTGGSTTAQVQLTARGDQQLQARYPAQGSFAASASTESSVDVTKDEGSLNGTVGCSAGGGGAGGLLLLVLAMLAVGSWQRRSRSNRRGVARLAAPVVAALLLLTGLHVAPARAQVDVSSRSVNRFHAASAESAWFSADSLAYGEHGFVAFGVTGDYGRRPLVVYDADDNTRVVVVENSLLAHFNASVTLRQRFRLSASAPMAVYQDGNDGTYDGRMLPSPKFAFGDMTLAADVRLLGDSRSPLRAAVGVRVTVPTGMRSDYMSDSKLAVEPRAMIAGSRGRFEYAGGLSALLRSSSQLATESFGSELRYTASAGVRLMKHQRLLVGPELTGALPLTGSSGTGYPTELGAGAHYRTLGGMQLGLGANAGVVNAVGVPVLRVFLGIAWMM